MKNLVLLIFSLILLYSCTKNETNNTQDSTPTFKFKANGVQYEVTGSPDNFDKKGTAIVAIPNSYYLNLYAKDKAGINVEFNFVKRADTTSSPTSGTFNLSNFWCDLTFGGKSYYPGVASTTNITSTANGKYSGTFTATLKEANTSNTIMITEGTFENLPFIKKQ